MAVAAYESQVTQPACCVVQPALLCCATCLLCLQPACLDTTQQFEKEVAAEPQAIADPFTLLSSPFPQQVIIRCWAADPSHSADVLGAA